MVSQKKLLTDCILKVAIVGKRVEQTLSISSAQTSEKLLEMTIDDRDWVSHQIRLVYEEALMGLFGPAE